MLVDWGSMREQRAAGIILVADSSDGCLDNNLKEAFEPTDYALLHVRNELEANALLELLKSEIELAIIEAQFPAVNGFDLIGRLVIRDQPKPVKIIRTTVDDRPLSSQIVKELRGDAVVCKPILPHEWRKTVQAVLSGKRVDLS
jgi:DNA-binding response OmpR family regulator